MKIKECPSCAMEVEKQAQVCPICGYEFPQQKSTIRWIALVMLILFTYPLVRLAMRLADYLFH